MRGRLGIPELPLPGAGRPEARRAAVPGRGGGVRRLASGDRRRAGSQPHRAADAVSGLAAAAGRPGDRPSGKNGPGGVLRSGRRAVHRVRVADADDRGARAAGRLVAREAAARAEAFDGLRADGDPAPRRSAAGTHAAPRGRRRRHSDVTASGFEALFLGTDVELEAAPFVAVFARELHELAAAAAHAASCGRALRLYHF